MKVYSEKTRIKSYHVDNNGKLSTVQVFNFLQEAAFRHSVIDKFGQPDLAKLGLVWMLSRMKVMLLEDALLSEMIEIKSWVRSINGALSERDFIIVSGGKVIVKATSLWACLSINPVKPTAIPTEISKRMYVHSEFGKDFSTLRIASIKVDYTSHNYIVKTSDVDMVNHTNNVVYVRTVLDAINSKKKLKHLDINYLLQSFEGDELIINSHMENSSIQFHEVVNEKDRVVCRLKSKWE